MERKNPPNFVLILKKVREPRLVKFVVDQVITSLQEAIVNGDVEYVSFGFKDLPEEKEEKSF